MHGGEFDPSTLASQALPLLVAYLQHVGGRLRAHREPGQVVDRLESVAI